MTIPAAFKNFSIFNVLDDGETFSGAESSTLVVYPLVEKLSAETLDDLENGCLPQDELDMLAKISLKDLLTQALAADLPAVKDLAKLLA